MSHFPYGSRETEHLTKADPKMGGLIERFGRIERPLHSDLYAGLLNQITGQQISTKAHATVWLRLTEATGLEPERIARLSLDEFRPMGISVRKAERIQEITRRVRTGELDLNALRHFPDEKVVEALTELPGVGRWTAEMLLLFGLARPDVLSFGDFGVRRGLTLLHGIGKLDRPLFERYRRLYSPYGSTAALYLWALSGNTPNK